MKQMRLYFENIGQAFFLKNSYFGAALLALFLVFDRHFFICGVAASLICFLYTVASSTPKILKDSGLITLNGFFFGIAMASLFHLTPLAYLCLFLGALSLPLLTKATFEVLQHWKLSPFVFPYILAIWVVWLCGSGAALELRRDLWPEIIATLPPVHPDWPFWQVMGWSTLQGMGRLLFLPDSLFGLSVLALVTVFSPRRAIFFLLGTALASGLASLLSGGTAAWQYGFFSYSAGLVALGLAASPEKLGWKTILLTSAISAILTMAAYSFFGGLKLPVLSLPYIVSMWVALLSRIPRVNLSWAQTPPISSRTAKARREVAEKVA